MKRFDTCVPSMAATLIPAVCLALVIPRVALAQTARAFPTAEGFGAGAVGGRGGRVIEVVNLVGQAQYAAAKPFPAPPVAMDAAADLLGKVLASVGACKPARDAIDQRVVRSVRDGTGSSRISTTGPSPDLAEGAPAPPPDSDHDGVPDAWEIAHGLDPGQASDGATYAANGYTHVENCLNELAGDPRSPGK
jgi:hypothetical protein